MPVDSDEVRRRLLRDIQGSGTSWSELTMPTAWPVLTGSRCELRVLTEEDADAWRLDEDDKQFVSQDEFYVPHLQVQVEREIRARRVAWAWAAMGSDTGGSGPSPAAS